MEINDNLKKDFPALYNAALSEFAIKQYESASLNDILKNARISKGSFYYNFKDKYDLYLRLLSCIVYRKMEIWKGTVEKNKEKPDFYQNIRLILINNCRFIFSEPLLNSLYTRISAESEDFTRQVHSEFRNNQDLIWYQMIKDAVKNGEIRDDISEETAELFLDSAVKGIGSSLARIKNEQTALKSIDEFIMLLKDSLQPKRR